MNKTIIININGIVFHIEEDAYEMLRAYMIDVKKHFAYTADSKEIVDDIENRIAEMFTERISAGKKEVITFSDVDEVCAIMGRVSDFEKTDDVHEVNEDFSSRSDYEKQAYSNSRKLFRDPDDKVFGGVCSGLAHYLDVEGRWIRLAMLLLFIFAGTGLLLYIILWIVVPQAKTRADRMAMRGEAPNLQNFKRNFDEEMEGLNRNFTEAGERISPGLNKAGNALEKFIYIIGKLIFVFIKVLAVIIILSLCGALGTAAVLLLYMAIAGDGATGFGPEGLSYFLQAEKVSGALFTGFLLVAVPLIALIFLAIRILFNRKIIGNYVGFTMLIIWLIAAGAASYYAVETATDFAEEATIVQEHKMSTLPVYYLSVHDVNRLTKSIDSVEQGISRNRSTDVKRKMLGMRMRRSVEIYIQKADSTTGPKLIEEYKAKGGTFEAAARRAERISYSVEQLDEQLIFDNVPSLPNGEIMRDQGVKVKILLPVGAKLYITQEAERYLHDLPTWQCRDSYPEGLRNGNTEWVMTDYGLKCIERPEESNDLDGN